MKTVLISAFSCCPNRGSEPGNGWNWVNGYHQNGYKIKCITSALYKQTIEKYIKNNNILNVEFIFITNPLIQFFSIVPIFGVYLHYYSWIIYSRKYIKKIIYTIEISHIHHITYNQIKYGTPVYNLPLPTILGPLGGTGKIDNSLCKYIIAGKFKLLLIYTLRNFLSIVNPSVSKSIKSSSLILYSNKITLNFITQFSPKKVIQMFDAGLSDNYRLPFSQKNLKETINILWVGRILSSKGLNLALHAFHKLETKKQYRFIIVGDGPYLKQMKNLAKTLNINDRVDFVGAVSYSEIMPFYRKSHVFLFPSLKDSCPMQVFEAMANGLPVVTLDHQGMSDQVVDGSGIKVKINKKSDYPSELAEAIQYLTEKEITHNTYSESAYKFGQKQIWSYRIKLFLEELNFNKNISY